MIYIKYSYKNDPTHWDICAHEKGSKEESLLIDSRGNTYPYKYTFNLKFRKKYYDIKYLTKKQVDLLKLGLL